MSIDRSALAQLLDARIPKGALGYGELDALTTDIELLVRPVDGIVLTPEEAALAAEAVAWERRVEPRHGRLLLLAALAARLKAES